MLHLNLLSSILQTQNISPRPPPLPPCKFEELSALRNLSLRVFRLLALPQLQVKLGVLYFPLQKGTW